MAAFNEFRFTDRKPKSRKMTIDEFTRTISTGGGAQVRLENIANAIERNCRIKTITLKAAA